MKKTLAAVAVLAMMQVAFAEGTSVAVRGMAPTSAGSFSLRQAVVQYGDLNAGDKQGAAALLDRINKASDTVCRLSHQLQSVRLEAGIATCKSRAVAAAVASVGSAELSAAAGVK